MASARWNRTRGSWHNRRGRGGGTADPTSGRLPLGWWASSSSASGCRRPTRFFSSASSRDRCPRWSQWASCSSTAPTASSTSRRARSVASPRSLPASLIVGPKWSFFPAVVVGLLAAIVLGARHRVPDHPPVRQGAASVADGRHDRHRAAVRVRSARAAAVCSTSTPLPSRRCRSSSRFDWDPVVFNGGHVLIIIVVPIVAFGLGAFFRLTRIGIAVRASAESADRAALLGIPVKRIGTLGVDRSPPCLSALGVLLRMPIQGVNIGGIRGHRRCCCGRWPPPSSAAWRACPRPSRAALVLGMVEQAVLLRDRPHRRRRRHLVLRHRRRPAVPAPRRRVARRRHRRVVVGGDPRSAPDPARAAPAARGQRRGQCSAACSPFSASSAAAARCRRATSSSWASA